MKNYRMPQKAEHLEYVLNSGRIQIGTEVLISSRILNKINNINNIHLKLYKDKEYAKDTLVYFISNVIDYVYLYNLKREEYRNINSSVLYTIYGAKQYKFMMDWAIKERILIMEQNYSTTGFSRGYKINSFFLKEKEIITYFYKSRKMLYNLKAKSLLKFSELYSNPIIKNIINTYKDLELPRVESIRLRGKQLEGNKYRTKNGSLLISSSNANKYKEKVSIIERDIYLYRLLTYNGEGFRIPTTFTNAGGRVGDSINMMPSWIRDMIKYKGSKMIEKDFSTLHPNIVLKIYSDKDNEIQKPITHQEIADYLGKSRLSIKQNHLSFFNDQESSMKRYRIWDYYINNYPIMLTNLINDRENWNIIANITGLTKHKYTSRILFIEEVKLMTNIINILNKRNIPILYIYDALLVSPKYSEELKEIMNNESSKMNIKSKVL